MFMLFVLILCTVIGPAIASAPNGQTIANVISERAYCSSFRLLVIWHTSNGEDAAFIEQRRFLIRLLLSLPQGTEIQVTAISTQVNHLLHFLKNTTMDWSYSLSMYNPKLLEDHSIHRSLIKETVFRFQKQKFKKEVAELLVLVISEKTLIEKSLETIKNIKRCVVFTGWNPPQPFWTYLATDRQHLVMLNMTYESIEANINGAADTVLGLLCRDSRLICDTDEFWTGKICVGCSCICSTDTKKHQDICNELCPYYRRLSSKNTDESDESDETVTGESFNRKNDVIFPFVLLIIFCVLPFSILAYASGKIRRFFNTRLHNLKENIKSVETSPSKFINIFTNFRKKQQGVK